jgi:hypothetical protein
MNWIDLIQDRDQLEGSYVHGNEPSGSIKCREFLSGCTFGSFSNRTQLHEVLVSLEEASYNAVIYILVQIVFVTPPVFFVHIL